MVNLGLNFASILGIFLAISGAGLYLLRSIRPELSRDHDIFFAAIGLLCGFILLFQGWRLDPILQFGQLLLTGTAVFFAWESIKLRGVTTEQAKRSSGNNNNERMPDEERRPSSRVYRTKVYRDEYEELEPLEERPVTRRIRGTQEGSRSGRNFNSDDDDEQIRTRERKRSRPNNKDWDDDNSWEEPTPPPSSSSRRKRPKNNDDEEPITPPKEKRTRPNNTERSASRRRRNIEEATSEDYVDFKPVDEPE